MDNYQPKSPLLLRCTNSKGEEGPWGATVSGNITG